jgi:hypothetical protein
MKKKPTALESMDEINSQWRRLRTFSELLELCDTAPCADVDGRMVALTAEMMGEELDRMRAHLQLLEKEVGR